MTDPKRHIIRKQLIELELSSQRGALDWQRKLSRLFQDKIKTDLGKVFDGFDLRETVLRIPKLEVDLGDISGPHWERHFTEKCIKAIKNEVQKVKNQQLSGVPSYHFPEKKNSEAQAIFFHFLEKGTLPWHSSPIQIEELEKILLKSLSEAPGDFPSALAAAFRRHPQMLDRLFGQFSQEFIVGLMEFRWSLKKEILVQLKAELEHLLGRNLTAAEQKQLNKAVFHSLLHGKKVASIPLSNLKKRLEEEIGRPLTDSEEMGVNEKIRRELLDRQNLDFSYPLLRSIWKENFDGKKNAQAELEEYAEFNEIDLIDAKSSETESPHEREDRPDCEWFIDNAGLVICAYFLAPFFKRLKLVDKDKFHNEAAQQKAIHLTQYLVTGQEASPEYLLTLNKILCGWPVGQALERHVRLSEHEKEQAGHLLKAVIKHWTILGNTSISSLRNTFLARKGKLSDEPHRSGWLLRVEQAGYDICVERLPWTISLIKLPWMSDSLYVNWT